MNEKHPSDPINNPPFNDPTTSLNMTSVFWGSEIPRQNKGKLITLGFRGFEAHTRCLRTSRFQSFKMKHKVSLGIQSSQISRLEQKHNKTRRTQDSKILEY